MMMILPKSVRLFFTSFARFNSYIILELEENNQDYGQQVGVGLVLFITVLFASISGFSAGYYFSHQNAGIAILFSILWASLIYAIDSSMVISIRKTEAIENAGFWIKTKYYAAPFISRAIVGIMIGFFMSIPLEIYVFADNIELQIEDDNEAKIKDKINFVNTVGAKEEKETNKKESEKQLAKSDSLLKTVCPLPDYTEEYNNYNNCNSEASDLNDVYQNKSKILNGINKYNWNNGVATLNPRYTNALIEKRNAKSRYDSKKTECNRYKANADEIDRKWRESLQKDKLIADSTAKSLGQKINEINAKADSAQSKKDEQLKKLNGFARKYEALENAVHNTENGGWALGFLLWLIRLIFIGMEILPTFTKISSGISSYDKALISRDKVYNTKLQEDENIARETEQKRKTKEVARNEMVLDKVAEIQSKIADKILEEWEKQENAEIEERIREVRDNRIQIPNNINNEQRTGTASAKNWLFCGINRLRFWRN